MMNGVPIYVRGGGRKMIIGMIGLGKMGANMTTRLLRAGQGVVVYDRNPPKVKQAVEEGAQGADSVLDVVRKLEPPRAVWVMVPAGEATESVMTALKEHLSSGDIVIDGGNSNYHDTLRRGEGLAKKGIRMVDVGTSGGVWGLREGYSMMVGGEEEAVEHLRPILEALAPAPDRGWGRVGPRGAGHFVKMVHNGIEYGMMEAYAEGFEIMRAKKEFALDLHSIAEVWRYGSVVRSWLLDLAADVLKKDPELSTIKDWVADSGEGRWTAQEAMALDIPAPVITLSLIKRFASRQDESYAAKLLAALRNEFGGHAVKHEDVR
jgi:6-phosphogluconate dehydrogenase